MPRLNEIDYLAQIASNTGAGGSSSSFYDPRGSSSSVSTFPATPSSTSSEVLKAANANRKVITIYNDGAGILNILLGSGTASSTNYSVKLNSGDYLELDKYTGVITGIFLSAGTARVTEISS